MSSNGSSNNNHQVHSTTLTETVQRASSPTLRLKLKPRKPKITWTEDTVDNEHLNKKSSKRCCIYHKSKKFAESDSDESDSDVEEAAKQINKSRVKNFQRYHA